MNIIEYPAQDLTKEITMSNIPITPKHRKVCNKIVRQHNKSGLCEVCYHKNKSKFYTLK